MDLTIWHWLIVLLVVVLIFGTKKLRNIGQDLGGAVKGFKEGVKGADEDADAAKTARPTRRRRRKIGGTDDRRRGPQGNLDQDVDVAHGVGQRAAGASPRRG